MTTKVSEAHYEKSQTKGNTHSHQSLSESCHLNKLNHHITIIRNWAKHSCFHLLPRNCIGTPISSAPTSAQRGGIEAV